MGAFSSFINTNPINNPRINNINYIKNDSNSLPISKIHCTCKKTKCIKKYCECYSSGNLCYNCKCENCENKPYYNENIPNQKKEEENNNNIIELNSIRIEDNNITEPNHMSQVESLNNSNVLSDVNRSVNYNYLRRPKNQKKMKLRRLIKIYIILHTLACFLTLVKKNKNI